MLGLNGEATERIAGALIKEAPSSFTGADLQLWFNDIAVAHVTSLTATVNREIIGLYGMGTADPLAMVKGKRAIVGSMTLLQFDRDAILYEIFQLNQKNKNTNLLDGFTSAEADTNRAIQGSFNLSGNTSKGFNYFPETLQFNSEVLGGQTDDTTNPNIGQRYLDSVRFLRDRKLLYVDELPPINVTVIGANESGVSAYCHIFGLHFAQNTIGWSMNDLTQPTTYSFTALAMTPWTPIE